MLIGHSIQIADDVEVLDEVEESVGEGTCGALPSAEVVDDQTAKCTALLCPSCHRPPGSVAAPGVLAFDLGCKHVLNRLYFLLKTKIDPHLAKEIVLSLQSEDVEIP